MTTRYQEAFEAGRQYDKHYRRTHHSWSSDPTIARRAMDEHAGTHDMVGFRGVMEGLRPLSVDDFKETFERNLRAAKYQATALLGNVHLQIACCDHDRYQTTLVQWAESGATILEKRTGKEEKV